MGAGPRRPVGLPRHRCRPSAQAHRSPATMEGTLSAPRGGQTWQWGWPGAKDTHASSKGGIPSLTGRLPPPEAVSPRALHVLDLFQVPGLEGICDGGVRIIPESAGWVKSGKRLGCTNWQLQHSHRAVKYSTGNIINNPVITRDGARWAREFLGRSPGKLYKRLMTMLHT